MDTITWDTATEALQTILSRLGKEKAATMIEDMIEDGENAGQVALVTAIADDLAKGIAGDPSAHIQDGW